MQNKESFEVLYEEYKLRDDNIKEIDGETYFRIIKKDRVAGFDLIVLPNEVFGQVGNTFKDELGNVFQVGNPAHMSFRGEIPEWYLRTIWLVVQGISIKGIGEYVHLYNMERENETEKH